MKYAINFCHIVPTKYLHFYQSPSKEDFWHSPKQTTHLLLAHLLETDEEYTLYYRNLRRSEKVIYILDNSCFELHSQGLPLFDPSKLIDLAKRVGGADYIVMSDYPGEAAEKTIEAAEKLAPQLRAEGVGTFFCPQAPVGDLESLLGSYKWAASSNLVDYIGVSILAIPNAYGITKENKLQRFLCRRAFMAELAKHGILAKIHNNKKKVHFLGMLDGPNEIELVRDYHSYINSWDSSAASWLGANERQFDNSPSGLMDGKFEEPVDFNFPLNLKTLRHIHFNRYIIDQLCQR